MKNKGLITFAAASLIAGASLSAPTFAEHHEMNKTATAADHDETDKASDAWREGKLDTLYLFNRHLNNFTIDPEVRGTKVTLTGKVESEVDKELAEQLALDIDGITDVDNSELAQSEESVKDKERGGGSRAEGGAGRLSSGQCVVVEVVVEQSLV